jgi:hypothetical protein
MSDEQGIQKVNEAGLTVVNNNDGSGSVGDVENANIVDVEFADIREKVLELKNKAEENYWELGVVLADVYTNNRYRSWGFDSWKEYVEQELDFTLRKAQYLVKLQAWFENMTPAMQAFFRGIGWAKCRLLMGFVVKENAKSWKKRVEGKTFKQIEEMISRAKKEEKGITSGGDGSGGDGQEGQQSTGETLVRRAFSLYSGQDEVVTNAINRAKDIGETDKDGHALSLVCMDYLASSTNLIDTISLFRHMEDITGYRIIAFKSVDGEKDQIVFGNEYLVDLVDESEGDSGQE